MMHWTDTYFSVQKVTPVTCSGLELLLKQSNFQIFERTYKIWTQIEGGYKIRSSGSPRSYDTIVRVN